MGRLALAETGITLAERKQNSIKNGVVKQNDTSRRENGAPEAKLGQKIKIQLSNVQHCMIPAVQTVLMAGLVAGAPSNCFLKVLGGGRAEAMATEGIRTASQQEGPERRKRRWIEKEKRARYVARLVERWSRRKTAIMPRWNIR